MIMGPPSGVTEEEWAEHIHEQVEPVKTYLKKCVFAAVDLMLMPSQETYDEVRKLTIMGAPDFFAACDEITSYYSEKHVEYMLAYLMEEVLIRYWERILEEDGWYRRKNREWLDNEVIGAALAGSRDDEKAKVAEYLDQLKRINLYDIYLR